MRYIAVALSLGLAAPVFAETPMTAPEFDAYTQGRTLYFFNNGSAYGVEKYLSGNRVQWSFLDGECKDGIWYEQGSMICFVYDDTPTPQCWEFYKETNGLRAIFEGNPSSTVLYEATDADDKMICLGPKVGV